MIVSSNILTSANGPFVISTLAKQCLPPGHLGSLWQGNMEAPHSPSRILQGGHENQVTQPCVESLSAGEGIESKAMKTWQKVRDLPWEPTICNLPPNQEEWTRLLRVHSTGRMALLLTALTGLYMRACEGSSHT